jgi:glyceraldehyde 3-phosphate dehydrogenase
VVEFVAEMGKTATVAEVNGAFKAAAAGPLQGILGYTDEPLVSMDFKGDTRSSIVDGPSTMVIGGTMVKVVAWYDNEWAYSLRVADLAKLMADKGL